ncbi:pentatricopeptide repeat-containing protein, chloroplastic-like [Capsicum galapagoense]
MITGSAHNKLQREALEYMRLMINEGLKLNSIILTTILPAALKPDLVTVAIVLSVCGKLKVLKQGKEIHAYAVKNGFVPNASVSTRLMMMYSQCGLLQPSSRVFDIMENRNLIAWTLMSYIDAGCLDEAIGVFRSMQLPKHRTDAVAMRRILAN